MNLTYRYRLQPLKNQHRASESSCAAQPELYNAALEERIERYRKIGKTRTYIVQRNALTQCRHEVPLVPKVLTVPTHACPSCDHAIDRDHNASLNILRAGIGGALNVVGSRRACVRKHMLTPTRE